MFKLILQNLLKFISCLVLITSMGCASTPKKETTGQYIDDSVITTRVKTAIFTEKDLKSLQINVKTYKGVVQLSGFVDSSQEVAKAGAIAKKIENVVSVKNDIVVK